jgi:excisionase family DNA binding protein
MGTIKTRPAVSQDLHRIPEVAAGLDVSMSTVRRLVHYGHLEGILIGKSLRITDRSYRRLIEHGTSRRRPRGKL